MFTATDSSCCSSHQNLIPVMA